MADAPTFKIVGDWSKTGTVGVRDAMTVSQQVFGRTAVEAVRHAVIMMAKAARSLTPKAKKLRRINRSSGLKGWENIEIWAQGRTRPFFLYKWMTEANGAQYRWCHGKWDDLKKIKRAGLAKRSWMWGLGEGYGGGASYTSFFRAGQNSVGFVKVNKLSYIQKIMAQQNANWQQAVTVQALNKLMGYARDKLFPALKGQQEA